MRQTKKVAKIDHHKHHHHHLTTVIKVNYNNTDRKTSYFNILRKLPV